MISISTKHCVNNADLISKKVAKKFCGVSFDELVTQEQSWASNQYIGAVYNIKLQKKNILKSHAYKVTNI